jgi:hypothetical protein
MIGSVMRGASAASELVERVWTVLGLARPHWQAFADSGEWARWEDRQRLRWESRAKGAAGLWFLSRQRPFHPWARRRRVRAHELVARLAGEHPSFWLHRAPRFASRARVGEAMALLRRAESELRRADDELALAVALDLQAALWRGSLDNAFEAAPCEEEAARLAEAGGWRVLAAVERTRGELWESWWIAETGGGRWWRSSSAAQGD